MDKQELISAITEAIELSEENKHKKEIAESRFWRIVECITIVLVVLALSAYFFFKVPLIKAEQERYTVSQFLSHRVEEFNALDKDSESYYTSASEYYSENAEIAAFMIAFLVLIGFIIFLFVKNAYETHT
ncbi:MAG: hypothetical protein II072_00705, partial [Clostridia bacterium]|nr:hypothetical protein [Clostridia bacterium]